MNWLSALTAAALFAAACNLDTVLLSAGFATRGVVLRRGYGLVIAALTTLITWLSLALGAGAAALLGGRTAQVLGGLVLAGMGAWFLLDWLRRPGPPPEGAEEAEEAEAAGLGGGFYPRHPRPNFLRQLYHILLGWCKRGRGFLLGICQGASHKYQECQAHQQQGKPSRRGGGSDARF